jgi:transcription-repair coupling factor (superfamily II helicase)
MRDLLDRVARAYLSGPGGRYTHVSPALAGLLLAAKLSRSPGRMAVLVPGEEEGRALLAAFQTFLPEAGARSFPPYPVTPYDFMPLPISTRCQAVEALHAWRTGAARLLAVPAGVLPYPFPPSAGLAVALGLALERDAVPAWLARSGYQRVPLVAEKGEFAVRGFIVDVFPPHRDAPLRLEWEGERLAFLRTMDPFTQRSTGPADETVLLPLRLWGTGADGGRLEWMEGRVRGRGGEKLVEQARQSGRAEALELFFGGRAPLEAGAGLAAFDWELVKKRWGEAFAVLDQEGRETAEGGFLDLPAAEFFFSPADEPYRPDLLMARLGGEPGLDLPIRQRGLGVVPGHFPTLGREFRALLDEGYAVTVSLRHPSHRKALGRYFDEAGLPSPKTVEGALPESIVLEDLKVALLASGKLVGEPPAPPRPPSARAVLPDLDEFKPGERVVHAEHGIGMYQGLHPIGGAEFVKIKFADGDIYLPMERLDTLTRYRGATGEPPPLDRIGSNAFQKRKKKARKAMKSMVGELLDLYAMRKIAKGHAFAADTEMVEDLVAGFAFEPTPDQARTWEEVKADMEAPVPMDRLVCGDVGFGKTEVAIRAAFKAVQDGFQVAVLCPTTLLAFQHQRTFSERLAGFPVRVEWLSRFIAAAEQKKVVARVAAGTTDILIGTHRILSPDVRYANLGLLVIDEEQRFGVAQKERIRQVRKNVDTLTLTATPIPRTFHMALLGLKDMSLILTPPLGRFAVETSIVPFNPVFLRDAIRFELGRGGQVFFVHNRVERIEEIHAYLSNLVPEARLVVTHGQMGERPLERAMMAFIRGEADLLLTTTIIENGIDIPHANTLIVNNAHTFGLAQLYQLRGRVGRSDRQAFCYLTVPSFDTITEGAMERLRALEEFTALGSGFRVAAKDLEIRGAGDLLGREQSGNIDALGYDLYLRLLEKTVQEMKGLPDLTEEVELHLDVTAQIPPDYIPDEALRLKVYRQLLTAPLEELPAALRDQFGPPPPAMNLLLAVARVRRHLQRLKVRSVVRQPGKLVLRIDPATPVPLEKWIDVAGRFPGSYFSQDGALTLKQDREGDILVYWLDRFLADL